MQPVAFVSGPYSAPKRWRGVPLIGFLYTFCNVWRAWRVSINYWQRGYAVICPHANTGFMDKYADYDTWLQGCLTFIRRLDPEVDCLVMLPNWTESAGAVQEWALATSLGITVTYW